VLNLEGAVGRANATGPHRVKVAGVPGGGCSGTSIADIEWDARRWGDCIRGSGGWLPQMSQEP
jgi:hypothetical protein